MSWMRKLSLRFDEMLNSEKKNGNGASQVNSADSAEEKPKGALRHPKEASFIKAGDYGQFQLRFDRPKDPFVTDKGEPFVFSDLYTHMVVFGESGSGKTSFVLNQFYEEMFHSTHLKDGPDRDKKKFGGLVVEAKGDFAPKTWDLAVKYGRAADVILFGPSHLDNVYDPFGDVTESPQQLADKMQAVMDSFSGGQKAQDPFWPAASRKLFTQVFHLHKKLVAGGADIPPMSFELMNLLLLDKGQPRNQGEIDQKAKLFHETYDKFNGAMDRAKNLCTRLNMDCMSLTSKVEMAQRLLQQEADAINHEIETCADPTPEWRRNITNRREIFMRKLSLTDSLRLVLSCEEMAEEGKETERLGPRLDKLRKDITGLNGSTDQQERTVFYNDMLQAGHRIRWLVNRHIGVIADAIHVDTAENLERFRASLLELAELTERIEQIGTELAQWQTPQPVMGMLKRMLTQYEEMVRAEGADPAIEPICAYFYEEYLNPANDKTSGSVAMTASNLVNLFIHPPFNQIFSSQANFNMARVIDEGKIVVMDMPQAKFGVIFNIAALIMKVDFFRSVLSRKVLFIDDPANPGKQRKVNQDRPLTYFCDEFASIATTGDTTGEAGFLDKCREYKCACILATQSTPMLLKKLQESEVDAILTNCGVKIFLRNSDHKTTEMASKILGTEIKVAANNTMSAEEEVFKMNPQAGRGYSTSYNRAPKFDPSRFPKLKNGEIIYMLNPRYGKNQTGQAQMSLHPIDSIDKEGVVPFPIVTQAKPKKKVEATEAAAA